MDLPAKLKDCIDQLSTIPGIGQKTALRQALFLTGQNDLEIKDFADSLIKLTTLLKCEICGLFSDHSKCNICSSDRFNSNILCIVETVTDCIAIENSDTFLGKYHCLNGVLNPLLGIGPNELQLNKLFERIKNESVEEVILALNPSIEGDATSAYIKQQISENVKVERIGFGIPIGSHIEYLDSLTITKALENRQSL